MISIITATDGQSCTMCNVGLQFLSGSAEQVVVGGLARLPKASHTCLLHVLRRVLLAKYCDWLQAGQAEPGSTVCCRLPTVGRVCVSAVLAGMPCSPPEVFVNVFAQAFDHPGPVVSSSSYTRDAICLICSNCNRSLLIHRVVPVNGPERYSLGQLIMIMCSSLRAANFT